MLLTPDSQRTLARGLLDVLIRAGLVAGLVIYCYQVLRPFLYLMIWSVILAINLYPVQRILRAKLGGKDGRAATLIVLTAFALLAVPIYLLATSVTDSAESALEWVKGGTFHISPPPESVASWPLVGGKIYAFWQQAATDLTDLALKFAPQLKDVSLALLGTLAGFGLGLMMFLVAVIIGGIIMAFGENGSRSAVRIAERIFGPGRGANIAQLCTATIRTVAQGVIGIAFAQMLLIGVGFVLMGVPGAGLLALGVLLSSALALGGCSISIADLPLVGAPADAPARPKETGAYMPVNQLPPDREEAAMDPAERAKIQSELITARERQASAAAAKDAAAK